MTVIIVTSQFYSGVKPLIITNNYFPIVACITPFWYYESQPSEKEGLM